MTRRRPRAASARRSLNADDFPALRDFLSGYLHEDFAVEHGTPDSAVRAFARDARREELEQLRDETRRLAAQIDGWSWSDARRAFATLGGAWTPASRAALRSFLADIATATDG
jgi:hypothetical protein